MEKTQVCLESLNKSTAACFVKRFKWIILISLLFCVFVFNVCYPTLMFTKLDHRINSVEKKQNESYQRRISIAAKVEVGKRFNDTEIALRRFTNKRMNSFRKEIDEIRQTNSGNRSTTHDNPELSQHFKEMNDHLNVLNSTIGNLGAVVLRMNTSSDSKMSRLRNILSNTSGDLASLHNKLMQLNHSLHTWMVHFGKSIVSTVKDLRVELDTLSNITTTKTNELWKHWNRTDEELDDILKLIFHQNRSLHSKVDYHSDALYLEVKKVEKLQLTFHNDTIRKVKKLRNELNYTRDSLKQIFTNELRRSNKSLYVAIGDISRYLRSSVAKINIKVDGVKKDFQTNIEDILKAQKELRGNFSKTKAEFQEKDKQHDKDISGQNLKLNSVEGEIKDLEGKLDSKTKEITEVKQDLHGKIKDLEEKLDLKTRKITKLEQDLRNLRDTVNSIKNQANRVLTVNIPVFHLLFISMLLPYVLY